MNSHRCGAVARGVRLGLGFAGGLLLLAVVLLVLNSAPAVVHADPIPPGDGGYPKFILSTKTVTPTLTYGAGRTLTYTIELVNTGAQTATDTTLTDLIPANAIYNHDAQSSGAFTFDFVGGTLTGQGEVGFDSTVVVTFSVDVEPAFIGTLLNTAVISDPAIAQPITMTAETVVVDVPILTVEKTSVPARPGPNGPITYTIVVANWGQPAVNLPLTVTDWVPLNTTVDVVGQDGTSDGSVVTWTRPVTLELGAMTVFTFSVDVGAVSSGTVIANDVYQVESSETGVTAGDPYTVTVVDPILLISKEVWPDPPGSNRELTYTLTVLNVGSLATGIVVTDRVPAGVTYLRGGSESGGIVSWSLPRLDTRESAEFTFTVYISDVRDVAIINYDYGVCADGLCEPGEVLTNVVQPAHFVAYASLDPYIKKPGAGTTPVTPTLVVHNLGPGNAVSATARLDFDEVQVAKPGDSVTIIRSSGPTSETLSFPSENSCAPPGNPQKLCKFYYWDGNLDSGESITFTVLGGTNTTMGDVEGAHYTITIAITDALSVAPTEPVTATATAVGTVTLKSNVLVSKEAPPVIGRGWLLPYTIEVYNSALTTDDPPFPWLTEVVPKHTTLVDISDDGVSQTLAGSVVISWTLPKLPTGGRVERSFTVRVDDDLVSGTQILNSDYEVGWYEEEEGWALHTNVGEPVTTTVREVGLIDSYKEVTPALSLPGPNVVLTYYLHIANSSPLPMNGVAVYDWLPWESSTYRRDAVASAPQVVSDIVSIEWTGDVPALSTEVLTFTVLVDPDFQGPITNTAVISHPSLPAEVIRHAVAYITERPALQIRKSAAPDPVESGAELAYTIQVVNLGQKATQLVITDVIPADTTYVDGSATGAGELVGDQLVWETLVLDPGES